MRASTFAGLAFIFLLAALAVWGMLTLPTPQPTTCAPVSAPVTVCKVPGNLIVAGEIPDCPVLRAQ
jgi:quinol-cytochrome oxidoreductase complex cytochrome b subunit